MNTQLTLKTYVLSHLQNPAMYYYILVFVLLFPYPPVLGVFGLSFLVVGTIDFLLRRNLTSEHVFNMAWIILIGLGVFALLGMILCVVP